VTAEPQPAASTAASSAPVVSNAGTTQDSATYSCQCGFVFEAPVMTTVDCPHCKTPQAW
jgi:predicted Zn-ribbon and HTH transcriptional regulator